MTMYLEHFGLREAPFRITPHTEFFFAGANRGATLEALVYAITAGEGLVKVTGEVGTGKTMLCRVLMERLPETVETIYLAVPSLTRDEMLVAIASELGIATQGSSTTQLLRGLQDRLVALHAEGRQVVALIDEAHAMPLATLEEIRLLSNLETGKAKLLQIVLFGQPELDEHLNLPHMRQLKERITHAFNLLPLPPRDIHDYISFRLRAAGYHGPDLFGPEALRIISDASEGLTRRINIYADKTLLAAFAAGTHTVSPDHARAAVSDTQIVVAPKTTSRSVAVAAAAGLACGIAIGYAGALFLNPAPEIPAPAAAAPSRAPVQAIATSPAPVAPPPAEAAAAASPAVQPPAGASGLVTPAASPPPAAPASSAPVEAPATKGPKGLESRFTAGLALLEGASGGRYVVQLMMTDARDPAYLQAYLAEASRTLRPEELYLYPSGSADSPKVGVLYGAFQTRKEASDAMDALPGNLRQFRPYVRAVEAVRNDVRRVPAA
jgi:type II secretory pathway predicted ATPase ExeA/septal ring-binding cell division protein DamX